MVIVRQKTEDAIPSILSGALGVSFDSNVGHDYIEDASERFDFYTRKEDKIPFDIELLNKITKGGLTNKSLNIALAGTGVGKSLFMCHVAAASLMQGKKRSIHHLPRWLKRRLQNVLTPIYLM